MQAKLFIENISGEGFIAEPVLVKKPKDGDTRGGIIYYDQSTIFNNGEIELGIAKNRSDFGFGVLVRLSVSSEGVFVNETRFNVGDTMEYPKGDTPKMRVSCVK